MSPMTSRASDRLAPRRLPACSRSRTTSDLDILRSRDSTSISATSFSGRRTVRVFMYVVYYAHDSRARRGWIKRDKKEGLSSLADGHALLKLLSLRLLPFPLLPERNGICQGRERLLKLVYGARSSKKCWLLKSCARGKERRPRQHFRRRA